MLRALLTLPLLLLLALLVSLLVFPGKVSEILNPSPETAPGASQQPMAVAPAPVQQPAQQRPPAKNTKPAPRK